MVWFSQRTCQINRQEQNARVKYSMAMAGNGKTLGTRVKRGGRRDHGLWDGCGAVGHEREGASQFFRVHPVVGDH